MKRKPQGVISYAGLDVPTLLAGARLMFAGSEEQLPRRFAALMPLMPMELIQSMPFVGVALPGQNVAPGGFSIDPATYHCMLHEQMPRLYVGDNLVRNTDAKGVFHGRGVVTVDEAWATCFPQYQQFVGERLTIYPLGGGAQVAAVPESLYPRAAAFLRAAETALGVTRRCHDYAHYVYQRIRAGETFDADTFENDYLAAHQLTPVTLTQSDLGRVMQDISMLKNAREGSDTDGLYTENAKRAEHILQYVPGLYACDVFEDAPITRYTARLLQPVWEDGFVSDWWLPYADAAAYAGPDRQTLDMAALCQGFQLSPVYDPITRGGSYPHAVRVVILREKDLRLRMADALNNPAYGSGMGPQGSINKLVYLQGSRELLRQGKLTVEEHHFRCENTAVSPKEYRAMTAMAALQEWKGRLVDALYRRESVLSEVRDTSPDKERLHTLMNQPVDALEGHLSGREKAQLSGYDADLDYLRRMGMEREWKPAPNKQKTFRFAPDSLREASIESGFAMRAACLRHDWASLALPGQEDVDTGLMDAAKAVDPVDSDVDMDAQTDAADVPTVPSLPPLWLDAADPCYLTPDVGGTAGVPPVTADPPQEQPVAADDARKPAKPKKAAKSKNTGKAAKTKAAKAVEPPKDHREFSDEEMERRQVLLVLPEEEAKAPAGDSGEAAMPVADEADAAQEAQPVQEVRDETASSTSATTDASVNTSAQDVQDESSAEAAQAASIPQHHDEAVTAPAPDAPAAPVEPFPQTTPAKPEAPITPASPKASKAAKPSKASKGASQPLAGQISFLTDDLL